MANTTEPSKVQEEDMPINKRDHGPAGLTIYLREDPRIRFWLPLCAIQTFRDLTLALHDIFHPRSLTVPNIYRNDAVIPPSLWTHVLCDGAVYGVSYADTIGVNIHLDRVASPNSELYLYNVPLDTKVSQVKRLFFEKLRKISWELAEELDAGDGPQLFTREDLDERGPVLLEDSCEISTYRNKVYFDLDVDLVPA